MFHCCYVSDSGFPRITHAHVHCIFERSIIMNMGNTVLICLGMWLVFWRMALIFVEIPIVQIRLAR